MDTKHTRGPWKVGEELASDGDFVIKATSGYGIGQAWNLNGNTENAANAKMIAAAPELLDEVCRLEAKIAKAMPARHDDLTAVSITLTGGDLDAIRALIAKATTPNT